jgi:isoleucyl-tRNA synthetase
MSTALEDIEPTKLVLGHATVLAEDGREMHKSWGNAIEFNDGADKMGVDVMRWMFVRQNVSDNILFGYKTADETRRRFHLKLWNIYSFFVNYANLDGWSPTRSDLRPGRKPTKNLKLITQNLMKSSQLDRWILMRLQETLKSVEKGLDYFDVYSPSEDIEQFVNDLSNWYIRRSRNRVGPIAENRDDKDGFYNTCYFTLTTLCKIMSPFLPFVTDEMYMNLVKDNSVHLTNWPNPNVNIDKKLLEDMDNIRLVAEAAHALRKDNNIPVRQPLNLLSSVIDFRKPTLEVEKLLLDEINVRKWNTKKGTKFSNKLDMAITPELKEEADTRMIIRKIQNERKNMGLNLTHKTKVISPWLPKSKILLQLIKKKTSTTSIEVGKTFKLQKSS